MNIPTQELKDFVAEDEVRETRTLYGRDPSLDPQLVWKGKDEQDREDLAVPTVPVYIQEKIHPSAIIADLKARAQKVPAGPQLDLFGDFNGIDTFEKKVDFYNHQTPDKPHWTNRMILGDSLLVMNSLAEKEGLKGKVQMIYLDPPYGIKFGSNWQVSTRKRQVADRAEDATRQPEQVRAFRDTWKLGIHSYLSYLRDRLVVARELLTDSGSVFVQIGDENVHLVRSVLDEVFGAECHVVTVVVKKKGSQKSTLIDPVNDYLLWYSKTSRETSERAVKFRPIMERREFDQDTLTEFRSVELPNGDQHPIGAVPRDEDLVDYRLRPKALFEDFPGARLFRPWPITNGGERANQMDPIRINGRSLQPPKGRCWSHTSRSEAGALSGMARVAFSGRLVASGDSIDYKRYLDDFPYKVVSNWWDALGGAADPIYVVQTNPEIIRRCITMTTDPGDLVLDPTCGSGTTACVAEELGRRWITIDTSRVALTLARTRMMAARFPYYILADSELGTEREAEVSGKTPPAYQPEGDVRKGFVYKRAARVTSGNIANNSEIDGIRARYEPSLLPKLARLNEAAAESWEEADVPTSEAFLFQALPDAKHPDKPKRKNAVDGYLTEQAAWFHEGGRLVYDAFKAYDDERRSMRAEIEKAIVRRADPELLFDQPYEDPSRVRVTGPFTVESLAPHRVLQTADENTDGEVTAAETQHSGDFATMILDNLRKAGVQNNAKGERMRFDSLEPFAGLYLHAKGTYADANGQTRTVAVSIGPEFGTVGPDWIKEAAKEAVKGVGFDLLIVCAFSFDGYASEEAKQFGGLTVLPVRMNNDLSMGDELLKKTGAGNLFMVFGEPDLRIQTLPGGKIVVEVLGLDVYDPTTGQLRNNSTDDIAVWFIDTDYDSESFFVRHAYFLGADDPYDKLKRALRADIDEAAWSALYSTKSQPFDKPSTGKIAVKVINHYGDEVLKVYDVP